MGAGGCIATIVFSINSVTRHPLLYVTIWAQMVPCGHRSSWFAQLDDSLTREEGEEEEFTAAPLQHHCHCSSSTAARALAPQAAPQVQPTAAEANATAAWGHGCLFGSVCARVRVSACPRACVLVCVLVCWIIIQTRAHITLKMRQNQKNEASDDR